MKNFFIQLIILFFISFILHLIWENAQAPLYQGYISLSQHFIICLPAALADAGITLIIFGLIALLKNNVFWLIKLNKQDLFVLAMTGAFVAIMIEYRALILDLWGYQSTMPILPFFQVGLTPVLQMFLLLPFSLYLTRQVMKRYNI